MKQTRLKEIKSQLISYYTECQEWLKEFPLDEDAHELVPYVHNTIAKLSILIENKRKNKEG